MDAQYVVLSGEGPTPVAAIASEPDLPSAQWYRGAPIIEQIVNPLTYQLDPDSPGNLKPLYDELGTPLIRLDLLDVLLAAGVDNLQVFPAVVVDPTSGAAHKNYRALNVVGMVSAADMRQSRVANGQASVEGDAEASASNEEANAQHMIDVDFDSLAVDESKARGLLLFRLAETVTTIVVHASVRRRIENSGIEGIVFYGPREGRGDSLL